MIRSRFRVVGYRSFFLQQQHHQLIISIPSISEKKTKWNGKKMENNYNFAVLNATFHTSITFVYICMNVRCALPTFATEHRVRSFAAQPSHIVSLIQITICAKEPNFIHIIHGSGVLCTIAIVLCYSVVRRN